MLHKFIDSLLSSYKDSSVLYQLSDEQLTSPVLSLGFGLGLLDVGPQELHLGFDSSHFQSHSMCDSNSLSLWHNRFGHVCLSIIKMILKRGMIVYDAKELQKCVKSKMIKKCFYSVERSSNLFDLIHTDLCEFIGMLTRDDNKYFLTFIDDCFILDYVFLLKKTKVKLSMSSKFAKPK